MLLKQQNIKGTEEGIQKMLSLIWMKDDNDSNQSIKREVLTAYYTLYLKDSNHKQVAHNLVDFLSRANEQDAASFEELIFQIIKS